MAAATTAAATSGTAASKQDDPGQHAHRAAADPQQGERALPVDQAAARRDRQAAPGHDQRQRDRRVQEPLEQGGPGRSICSVSPKVRGGVGELPLSPPTCGGAWTAR